MEARIRAFLDSSALFAAVWSKEGGGRMVLRLGEAGAIRLLVSSQVLAEAEGAIRRKAPDVLGLLAILLDRCNIELVAAPSDRHLETCQRLVSHAGDATVLAAAWGAGAEYFITLDQKHFLKNRAVRLGLPFPLGTPGDFLAWLKIKWA